MIVEVKTEKRVTRTLVLNELEAAYLATLTKNCLIGIPAAELELDRSIRTALNASATQDLEGITSYGVSK
jgi:hypothetical protein